MSTNEQFGFPALASHPEGNPCDLLDLSGTPITENIANESFTAALPHATLFPDSWSVEKVGGTVRRHANLAVGNSFLGIIEFEPGFEYVGRNLLYEVHEDDFGVIETPGAGTRRLTRTIRNVDPAFVAVNNKPKLVVNIPGFAHTHRYHDTKWYAYMLAQISQRTGASFMEYNPVGRGVEGFDEAQGVSSISADQIKKDTFAGVMRAIHEYQKEFEIENLDVVLSGHSLSAGLARALATYFARAKPKGLKLTALIQDTPMSADLMGDFQTLRYLSAIFPYVAESLAKAFINVKGKDLSARDLVNLFYSEYGTDENLLIAGMGLQRGELRNFLDLTLQNDDIYEFRKAIKDLEKNGTEHHIILAGNDKIFDPKAVESMMTAWIKVREVKNAPHCYIPPIADAGLINEVREMLQKVYGVNLEMPPLSVI